MECQKPIVTLRQETGKRKKIRERRDKLQKGKEENEVENEKRGWKKNKGRDILRILSATYCSERTKAAKNSGNVASHSET